MPDSLTMNGSDTARSVAFNPQAPADERFDAQAELQRSAMPTAMSDLIPRSDIQPVIDYINQQWEESLLQKSLAGGTVDFPSFAAKAGRRGMQSVYLDDMRVNVQGDWFDKPGSFGFDSMRTMVDQTPILSAVIMTRVRQVQRFCKVNESGKGPGFRITTRSRDGEIGADDKASIEALQSFFTNCGWERRPRARARLKRDSMPAFMAKLVRDSLTMDSAPIETEWKRDRSLGLDGMYAVDGATIRLCTEVGYRGEDEIFALQVVQGQIRSAYTYDDLIYVPRNPRSDVLVGGYGMGETELLIRTVTGFLNAFTYNTKFFDSNSIPKGMLHLVGNFEQSDIAAFKRIWNSMVRGVSNAWTLPVMVSKDMESKAAFEKFGVEVNEIMFAKWMTFLTSIICAIYSIAPDEINFESFSAGTSSLSGSDTEEKLAASKDKGLHPLLTHFEDIFSDYVVSEYGDKYVFRWTGIERENEDREWEADKLTLTVNELRARRGDPKVDGSWGDAPLNPSLLSAWQAEQQQGAEDYGTPDGDGQQTPGAGQDFGQAGTQGGDSDPGAGPAAGAGETAGDDAVAKAFGLPIYRIE